MDRSSALRGLARPQHGAITTSQAATVGADRGWLARAHRRGEVISLRRGAHGVVDLLDEWTPMAAMQLLDAQSVALDRKSTRLNSSHSQISYAVFCLKKKKKQKTKNK